jgi:hypothetical protein
MTKKIHWIAGGDAGFWDSMEGRFYIVPEFIGRTTPQAYRVTDMLVVGKSRTDTVREAKAWALKRI